MKKVLKYLKYTLLLVVIGLIIVGVWWSNQQASADVCRNISIEITNSQKMDFVTEGSVYNMLNNAKLNPEGKRVAEINTQKMEDMLNGSEYIENAECILQANNDIHIAVTQLIPVLRVFDGNETYYLNKVGKRMSAAGHFRANVPVVSGEFETPQDALYINPIMQYVKGDESLNNLITMYNVKDKHNVILVPCISGHVINFGDTTNIENKFAKLKKFYREVMPEKGWQTYDLITLKWSHQIVARKRSKVKKVEIEYDPEEEEEAPPVESIMVGSKNDSIKTDTAKQAPKESTTQTSKSPKEAVSNAFGKKNKH